MIQHKKNLAQMRRWFADGRQASMKKKKTTYTLELLESRVLLSGDLAGAVQAVPVKPEVPQQAVVLTVPSSSGNGNNAPQQTMSVSQMLAKPPSSFPLSGQSGDGQTGPMPSHASPL